MEFSGGLGDVIIRMYFSGLEWYGALETLGPNEKATVVLMCHNKNAREIFENHPKKENISVLDLGFNVSFHPWENRDWRISHGLPPEAPCPPYAPASTLKFYPLPNDYQLLLQLKRGGPFVVMAATASTEDRTLPEYIRHECAREALALGFKVLVVGRSRYFVNRTYDIPPAEGVINAVDCLSVPGTIEAVKMSAGVITCHSSVLHMAWNECKPVFLAYNEWMKKNYIPLGPIGYMYGIFRKNTDHMEFSEYRVHRIRRWLKSLA